MYGRDRVAEHLTEIGPIAERQRSLQVRRNAHEYGLSASAVLGAVATRGLSIDHGRADRLFREVIGGFDIGTV